MEIPAPKSPGQLQRTWEFLEFFGIDDWEFSFWNFLGLRKTLGAVGSAKTRGKSSPKIPKSGDFPASIEGWNSQGSLQSLPNSLDPNFFFFFGYLGSHWARPIPGILGCWDLDQECWSLWRIERVFPFFGVFWEANSQFLFPLEAPGMQQFPILNLGVFSLGIFPAWEKLKSPNPSQKTQNFRFQLWNIPEYSGLLGPTGL